MKQTARLPCPRRGRAPAKECSEIGAPVERREVRQVEKKHSEKQMREDLCSSGGCGGEIAKFAVGLRSPALGEGGCAYGAHPVGVDDRGGDGGDDGS
jgi:hypothetical protein